MDFRDLNMANPKDDFPLPYIDVLANNAARNSMYFFMDGFSRYNQIKIALEHKKKMTFVTPQDPYVTRLCYLG